MDGPQAKRTRHIDCGPWPTLRAGNAARMHATLLTIAVLWLVFIGQIVSQSLNWDMTSMLGLIPRSLDHAHGMLTCHFAHGSWGHLIANSVALLMLMPACRWALPNLTAGAMLSSALMGGVLTWIIADARSIHVGASGVIFGLVGFLLVAAVARREWRALLIGLGVALLYGGSWVLLLPNETTLDNRISWQMHLGGALGGALYAWLTRHSKRRDDAAT